MQILKQFEVRIRRVRESLSVLVGMVADMKVEI